MTEHQVANQVTEAERREQMRIVYDHIKFDIGLYIGTPAALAVVADGLQVKQSPIFASGLILCIAVFLFAGLNAMHFMTKHFLGRWNEGYLERFEAEAFSGRRMFLHHQMYWVGVTCGLTGLTAAFLVSWFGYTR
jgi:hypothetical protein